MRQLVKGYSVIRHDGALLQFQPDWVDVKVSDGLTYSGPATGCPNITDFTSDDALTIALRGWARSAILQAV